MNSSNRMHTQTTPYIHDRSRIESYAKRGTLQPEAALAFQAKYPNDLFANEITADTLSARDANGHALAFRKRAVLISRFPPAQFEKFARACYAFGLLEDLGVIIREALRQHPASPFILGFLAEYHAALGQTDPAISRFEEAIQIATDERHRLKLKQDMADTMLKSDRVEPALEILHGLLPTRGHQVFALCRIAEFEKADLQSRIVQKMGELLNQPPSALIDEDRIALYLAHGNAAERSYEFDLAFQNWDKAHAIDIPPYNSGRIETAYRTNIEFYTESLFQRTHNSANPSHAPVFVMGMPRSGTTLVEQMLSAHAQCEGVGETGRMVFMNTAFLNKYYRPGGVEAFSGNVAKGELVTRGEDFLSAARLFSRS